MAIQLCCNSHPQTTQLRDLKQIGIKLQYVLLPRHGHGDTLRELKNWDLWGPLLLCLLMSVVLSVSAPDGQASLVFAAVFVIVWCGAAVVSVNAQLLGGNISFFQSVCVLGYCVFPLNLAAIMCALWGNVLYRIIVAGVGFAWATRASVVFMASMVAEKRRILAVYPVFLFYIVIAWMIVVS